MKKHFLPIVFLCLAMSPIACAGDARESKDIIVPANTAPSRWSLSAGVTASSIRTTFRADPALVTVLSGNAGSDAIYTGGPAGVVYADGVVGPPGTIDPGAGTVGFSGGTVSLLQAGSFGYNLSQALFRSTQGALSQFADDPDTQPTVGPYIKLDYLLDAFEKGSISAFAQYSFTTAFSQGAPSAFGGQVNRTFAYDVYTGDFSPTVDGAAVLDPAAFINSIGNGIAGLRGPLAPRETVTGSLFGVYVPESINLYLHTFVLGLDFTRDLGDRVHLVASTGPTLNLFDYDFHVPGVAVVNGVPLQVAAPQSDSGRKLRFGWLGRLGFSFDLDSRKIYFAELSGEYHWVQSFDAGTSIGSARVDASSWGVNLGFGRKF